MVSWFSRHIVIHIDPAKIEIRSKKGQGTFSPHIELDPKGIVVSVGKSEKSKSNNSSLHIFGDTWEGLHALIVQSYFKYFVSEYGGRLLRPVILLIPTKDFIESYGKNRSEYIALTLVSGLGSDVFLCDENQTPYGFFQVVMGRNSQPCGVTSIPATQAKRVKDRFKDLLRG